MVSMVALRGKRHVGVGHVVLARDMAHEDRLQTIREGGEVVLLTAAGCPSVSPAVSSALPITAVAFTNPRGLKITAVRLPLASVTMRACRTR